MSQLTKPRKKRKYVRKIKDCKTCAMKTARGHFCTRYVCDDKSIYCAQHNKIYKQRGGEVQVKRPIRTASKKKKKTSKKKTKASKNKTKASKKKTKASKKKTKASKKKTKASKKKKTTKTAAKRKKLNLEMESGVIDVHISPFSRNRDVIDLDMPRAAAAKPAASKKSASKKRRASKKSNSKKRRASKKASILPVESDKSSSASIMDLVVRRPNKNKPKAAPKKASMLPVKSDKSSSGSIKDLVVRRPAKKKRKAAPKKVKTSVIENFVNDAKKGSIELLSQPSQNVKERKQYPGRMQIQKGGLLEKLLGDAPTPYVAGKPFTSEELKELDRQVKYDADVQRLMSKVEQGNNVGADGFATRRDFDSKKEFQRAVKQGWAKKLRGDYPDGPKGTKKFEKDIKKGKAVKLSDEYFSVTQFHKDILAGKALFVPTDFPQLALPADEDGPYTYERAIEDNRAIYDEEEEEVGDANVHSSDIHELAKLTESEQALEDAWMNPKANK